MQSITIKSDKPVVLIPIGQYESTKETIELLSRHPNLTEELRQERRKIDTGDYISFEDFKVKYKAK
jgi:PHD/YefM family antitoxin component YafN of YafNO toxin-antitoxin module